MNRFDSVDSMGSDFECCNSCDGSIDCSLPFDPVSLESIILNIADNFDLRVVLGNERVRGAMAVTAGLAFAGGLIGQHYGGKVGAAVGTAVAGACGLGLVAMSMRDIWEEIKHKLSELYDIVYDYLAGLGIDDYKKAAHFVMQANGSTTELVMVIAQVMASTLGKEVVSSLGSTATM